MYEQRLDLGVPILCDPGRIAYSVFGFGHRSGLVAFWKPRYWARLLTALRRGRRFGRIREDPSQLGGDVVLDDQGRLCWVYRSRYPADRPTVAEVREQLRLAAGSGRTPT